MQKFKSLIKYTRTSISSYGIIIAAYLIITLLSSTVGIGAALEGYLVPVCVYIVLAVSLNLVVGISGELSLGHAGFMSIGAFVGLCVSNMVAANMESVVLRLIITLVVSGLFAGVIGFLIGIPVLRLRGDYLAIVTLAFGEIIKTVLKIVYVGVEESGALQFSFNDEKGLHGCRFIFRGASGATSAMGIATFTAGIILVLFTLFVVINLIHSRTGRAITALRDNRIAAESVGISATKYKMIAFVVSAALAGMAGALYSTNIVFTPLKLDYNVSIQILVFVVLGGMGNIPGTIISTIVLYLIPELFRSLSEYRMLIYAIVLIVVMLAKNSPKVKYFKDTLVEKVFHKKAAEEVGENV